MLKSKIARCAAAAALAGAGAETLRVSWAELAWRAGGRENFERAAAADPGNAQYLVAAGRLEEAARRKPTDSGIWMRLGLAQEAEGDYAAAEESLLRAARVDAKYDPRWTLANYYYRRANEEEFWRWARAALEMARGDQTPLFDLCWAFAGASGEILERAIPERDAVRLQFLRYLSGRGLWSEAARLAGELDRRGVVLEGTVFQWRAPETAGVEAVMETGGQGWRFALDGTQPERCELLVRVAPVAGGGRFLLSGRYRSSLATPETAAPATGLRWRITPFPRGGRAMAESEPLAASAERSFEARFAAPAATTAVRLALVYERQPASMRLEGTLAVSRPELSRLP